MPPPKKKKANARSLANLRNQRRSPQPANESVQVPELQRDPSPDKKVDTAEEEDLENEKFDVGPGTMEW